MMKYIEVELANQLIAMPIAINLKGRQEDEDESIVQSHDAQLEKYQQQQFIGYLIPPSEKWKGNNEDVEINEKFKPVNTKILKRYAMSCIERTISKLKFILL